MYKNEVKNKEGQSISIFAIDRLTNADPFALGAWGKGRNEQKFETRGGV